MSKKTSKKYTGVYVDKNGKYFYQVELGTDPITGKRIQRKGRTNKYGQPFKTAKDAYDESLRVKVEAETTVSLSSYNLTYADFMDKIYLKFYKQKVQTSTYRTALPHHKLFIEYFEKQKLRDISTRDCESFRLYIVEKYSENYAKNLWSRFKATLGYAERLGYINEFPCRSLDNPKGKHPDTKFWTFEEFQRFIKSFDLLEYEDRHRFTTIWLFYMTGVRVSEGLSLWWEDINFEQKYLYVHTTLEKDDDGNFYRKEETKTPAGKRYIELDDITLNILKQWREVQVMNSETDYILSRFGVPLCKTTIGRIIKSHSNETNVPIITGKGLRHSHASYLINVLKKDVLYVAKRLGHADKTTTLNTYSHWYHAMDESISDEITRNIQSTGLGFYPAKNTASI